VLPVKLAASSQKVELAARRAYWMHLNEGYKGLYIAHRTAEQEATELKWVSDWHRANPDKRNSFKRFIDKLLFRTQPIAPPAPQTPITFPSFEPTDIQRKNMVRLAELLESQTEDYVKEYPIELAEIYRELGMFDKASSLINGIKMENQDVVTNLILDLSNRKISAPVRYRY
jgi:ribonuclease D